MDKHNKVQEPHKMDTLSEQMNDLRDRGFKEEFKIENNKATCDSGKKSFSPNDLKVVEHYRFEGESDPADMTVLYAVESKTGEKGLLVDGYGTYSSEESAEFIKKIRELHKGDIY